MANGHDKDSSQSAVWDRLNQQSDLIGELARSQAHTEAHLSALAASVESGFNQITSNLNRVIERDSKPTNWFAAISALVVVGGGILTFNALQTDPVRQKAIETASNLDKAIEREMNYREEHGRANAQIEILMNRIQSLEKFQHDAQAIHGRDDELSKRVEDIDNYGSRRWNAAPPR